MTTVRSVTSSTAAPSDGRVAHVRYNTTRCSMMCMSETQRIVHNIAYIIGEIYHVMGDIILV